MKRIFLPGWGFQPSIGQHLQAITQAIALPTTATQTMTPPSNKDQIILIAWSLGGQWALKWAQQHPQHMAGLILIASTPCFCQQINWPHACSAAWLHHFQQSIEKQTEQTMQRFIKLMLQGEKSLLSQRRIWAEQLQAQCILQKSDLLQGLKMLHQHDLREQLQHIKIPVLLIHGAQDQVIPSQASMWMAQNMSNTRLHILENCGHAPLWTQAQVVNQLMENWCQQII